MNYEKHAIRKKQEAIHSTSTKVTKKAGISLLKIFTYSILVFMVVGIASGLGIAKAIIDSAPAINIAMVTPEGYATIIYDQNGNEVQKLHGEDANRISIELSQVPKHMQDAIIAIEDKRFWSHNGIDVERILGAIFSNLKEGDLMASGASTLTQQIIKNNVLSTEKKFERKIQEQYLAVQLEKQIDKEKILELYLNTSPFGRGALGVQAAANLYFNKDISEITVAEAACIAAITQRPTFYDPVTNPENNKKRQLVVLNEMLTQGYITQIEHDAAVEEEVYSHIQIVNNAIEDQSDYSYFVDEVINRVVEDLKVEKGYTENQAFGLVYRGGLNIYITQDPEIQAIVDEVYLNEENFPPQAESYAVRLLYTLSVQKADGSIEHHYEESEFPTKEAGIAHIDELKALWMLAGDTVSAEKSLYILQPQSAMVILDYHTGQVKAIAGGRGQKIGNQTFNRATEAKRQPGSTFKILAAYLPALDAGGYTLATVIDDVPLDIKMGSGTSYSPKNWYDRQAFNYRGLTPVRVAIKDSMNICAVKTLFTVGPDTAFTYLLNLGFTTLVDRREIDGAIYSDKTLALALGGITDGVTPLELTAAYGTIANGGVYVEPIFYTRVLSQDGSILLNKQPVTRTVMKDTTAFLLTSAMQSVVSSGTATAARFKDVKMPIAGKTGTTQDDNDKILCAYTPYYVASVWIGFDQPQAMDHSKSYHSIIWKTVMERVHANLEYKDFQVPDGIVSASVCSESGKLPVAGLCDSDPRGSMIYSEYFAAGTVPSESCDVHIKATICIDSGLFATTYCPGTSKVEKVFIVRPEPSIPENWDPGRIPRIQDFQYELPKSMEGEFCNIHGPTQIVPIVPELPLPDETLEPSIEPSN